MIWISIGIEVSLIIFVGTALWIDRRQIQRHISQEGKVLWVLRPAGRRIAKLFKTKPERNEKNQIYQIVCRLTGDDEGEKLFEEYRQNRYSLILGMIVLFLALGIGQYLISAKEPMVYFKEQKRPEYGTGDLTEQITVILEGEEKVKSTFSVQIPEKDVTPEEAKQRIKQGIEYIKNYFQRIRVSSDLTFPTGWEDVSFYYESLTPDLLSNSGNWVGEIGDESEIVCLKVTATLSGQSITEEVQFATKTLEELSAEERLHMLVEDIQDGSYLTEDELILPEETNLGEKLQWTQSEESQEAIWIFLGIIVLIFVLWKQDQEYKQLMKEREQHVRQTYPEFINELVILVGAGLSLPAAWRRIGQDYLKKRQVDGVIDPLYEEIYRESCQLDGGSSMREVLGEFTTHVRFKEARRFAVLMVQNLKRGDAFLISRLKELNQEAWALRKKQVREKTEEADTKLLIPLMLMLVVILIIVLSPAMISMQV